MDLRTEIDTVLQRQTLKAMNIVEQLMELAHDEDSEELCSELARLMTNLEMVGLLVGINAFLNALRKPGKIFSGFASECLID